jgi:predicted permease
LTEIRHAFRVFRKSPGFTAIAIVSLALGIGVNTAIFSLLNAVALRTLATSHPDRLAGLYTLNRSGSRGNFSYSEFEKIRDLQRPFASVVLFEDGALRTLDAGDGPFAGVALIASDGLAETVPFRPVIGRGLAPGDSGVAVLGYGCWRNHFDGRADALGKTIRVQGRSFIIVGVAPEAFTMLEGSGAIDTIIPVASWLPADQLRASRSPAWQILGRLRPGVSLARARAEMAALWPEVRNARLQYSMQLEPAAAGSGFNYPRMRFKSPLEVLMAIVGLLLLLASVNLATLLLARADARQRETGIRLALGAGRGRILRLYWTESLLLAGGGSAAGLACAQPAARFLARFVWTGNLDRVHDVPLDGQVLGFTVAIAVASGLLFGLIPALRALKTDPIVPLRQGSGSLPGAGRAGKPLVVLQVAISLILVAAAALFTGTLRQLRSVSLGFDSVRTFGMALMNRPDGYRGIDPIAYYGQLCDRVAKVPGVVSVSSSSLPPVMPPVMADQTVQAGGVSVEAQEIPVGPNFFATLEIPFVAGRDFTLHDTAQTPKLAILSASLARRLAAEVGQTVNLPGGRTLTVAGVVQDSAAGCLQKQTRMQLFTSMLQTAYGPAQPYVLVRSAGAPTAALMEQVRAQVVALGREYPIRIETMDRAISRALVQERFLATLAGGFGVLAILLASIGLYGLLSYSVVRRSHEIGVRMALGAGPRRIVAMVLRESVALAAAGCALGVPAVYAASKMLAATLPGVKALGSSPVALASGILLSTAVLAAYLPARRAAKLDPMGALRE